MKRWLDPERLTALANSGRLREICAIGKDEKARLAREWNGRPAPHALPWPPSGNTAVRHANGAHYLRPEVTAYRQAIAVQLGRTEPVTGRYELIVELSPPDKRTRDIDNVLKSLLDALVKAGWLPGDSMAHMRKLTVTVRPDYTGTVYVHAEAA